MVQRCRSNEEGPDVVALRDEVEQLARLEAEVDEHSLVMQNSLRALAEDEDNVCCTCVPLVIWIVRLSRL